MTSSSVLALDTSGLKALAQQPASAFWMVLALCVCVAAALIVTAVLLGRPRRQETKPVSSHSSEARADPWRSKVRDIVDAYESKTITKDEAFLSLAQLSRDFASNATGKDMSSHTLLDLHTEAYNTQQRGLDLLRQTIAALYPPEFADAAFNTQAREATVAEASEWVFNLIDRWGR
ncbi:hypothetical protein BPY_15080 [Bifidobacterium psychraerophilum]|uniref:hypothetical protein n=1 Tax=Bifidobacterium psychraerophilum TaxID=218140 RepID=UPI0031135D33